MSKPSAVTHLKSASGGAFKNFALQGATINALSGTVNSCHFELIVIESTTRYCANVLSVKMLTSLRLVNSCVERAEKDNESNSVRSAHDRAPLSSGTTST